MRQQNELSRVASLPNFSERKDLILPVDSWSSLETIKENLARLRLSLANNSEELGFLREIENSADYLIREGEKEADQALIWAETATKDMDRELPASSRGVISYDIETLYARHLSNEPDIPGIIYAPVSETGYWTAYDKVGISVICAYDLDADRFHCFSDSAPDHIAQFYNLTPLADFAGFASQAKTLVSFNGGDQYRPGFDNSVLAANGIHIPPANCYDILVQGWIAQGLDPLRYDRVTHAGGLGDYGKENLGVDKSMNGQIAPIAWQQGLYREVIEYCMLDCRITGKLYRRIQGQGWLFNPKTQQKVYFR